MEPAAARRPPIDVVKGVRPAPVARARAAASGTAARGGRRRPWSSFVVSWAALRRARGSLELREAVLFLCSGPLVAASCAVCAALEEFWAAAVLSQQHFVRKLRDARQADQFAPGSSPDLEQQEGASPPRVAVTRKSNLCWPSDKILKTIRSSLVAYGR